MTMIADTERVFDWIHARSGLVWVADFYGIAREVNGRIVAAMGYDHHQDSSCMLWSSNTPATS